MELPFVTLDVFTHTRYRGNPLAVVTIPAGTVPPPTQDQKQTIAREFNLSETVFIHDVADPEADTTRRIDIFLTDAEIPFAGHPTIGAAVSLLPQGVTQIITKAGPIGITRTGPNSAQADIPHNVHLHRATLADFPLTPNALQAVDQISQLERSAPIFSIVKGMNFSLVELPSTDLLAQLRPTGAVFSAVDLLDQGWNQGMIGRYYYVRTGTSEDADGKPIIQIRSRMILANFEDPATGSAACCLSSYLSVEGDKQTTPTRRYEITQGVEMGKESNIVVEVSVKDSGIDTVTLAGPAVQVMRGHVTV
ncbi:putative isomerase [Cladobotryum mycophilum]|uniref:Isomerase n=1 Tax=Cladobotryum mycophilum TaxID=491253 RepID=A0ABR0SSR3_9HYPO